MQAARTSQAPTFQLPTAHSGAQDPTENAQFSASVSGVPRLLLRLEGAAFLAAATALYAQLGAGWGLYAALFFAPDLAFFGYLFGARAGAVAYNTTHSHLSYLVLAGLSLVFSASLLPLALIGVAHVGFDRMLGYGLKYGSSFGHTHLGAVGKQRTRA